MRITLPHQAISIEYKAACEMFQKKNDGVKVGEVLLAAEQEKSQTRKKAKERE